MLHGKWAAAHGAVVRRMIIGVSAAVVLVLALYVARRPLLTAVGRFLIVQDAPSPADAIVVLSGSVPDRILEAVDLYQAQLAPRIILTQVGQPPGLAALRARGVDLPEQYELNLNIAQRLGVPAAAISIVPTRVASTLTEAQVLVAYLRAQGIKSILLVTSRAHTRRASLVFRAMADGNLQINICPSRYDPFAPESWWHQHTDIRHVVTEYGKLLNYLLIDQWRVRAPGPAAR
jgi:uncharacterized SAM-binding protein YcdF (DUF218 family)